ncbi:cysteine hydrolase family protein [Rhodococcus sp. SORGH_AS_0301]|uniref:cysteine hydrolase family protein n=1 Tax=Rhodococcus sp. SORGH_AS_0301 TaxID=3041780 RepID=UPI0027874AAB|nr:isochorismatase family protein [Rhodococcus sp. SORGH_AS_0301]MDQ1181814.1 nicotinamidase-related amidase [Rhodococcus sp. SORGH_AS_0301]
MSLFTASVVRTMRTLVGRRMSSQNLYGASDTAVVLVTTGGSVDLDDRLPAARLITWARRSGIAVFLAPRTPFSDNASHPPGPGERPRVPRATDDGVTVLDPFPGLSAFSSPALSGVLTDKHVDRVLIAGERTDIEVDSTARDATESGLHTTVVSDFCIGSSPSVHRAALEVTLPRLVHAVSPLSEIMARTR